MRFFAFFPIFALSAVVTLSAWAADSDTTTPTTPAMADVPTEAQQATASQTIKQLFKPDIDAAKNPTAKVELARKLLQQGIETQDDLPGKYCLLKMARDFAAGGFEPSVALQAIDEIGRSFNTDPQQEKLDLLTNIAKQQLTPAQSKAFVEATSGAMDDAVTADSYEIAGKLSALASAAAKKVHDGELIKQLTERAKEIDSIQSAFSNVAASVKTLDDKPVDPEANYVVGYFRAVVKLDWDSGVPYLALGSDAKLKAIALLELNSTDTGEDMVKIADAWWSYASSLDGTIKEHIENRAMMWYSKAMPKLTGLVKLRVEERLKEVGSRLYTRIQNAMRTKKYTVTPVVGGNHGAVFNDGVVAGGLLIGLDIGIANYQGERFIGMVRPVFATSDSKEVTRDSHGQARGETLSVRAREGYAIGGLTIKASNRIDGLSVTFMQIQGAGLSTRNSYASDWYGSRGTTQETRIGGSGAPVIGVTGRTVTPERNTTFLEALGLMLAK